MKKKFIKVPKDRLDRILLCLHLAQEISGKPTSKSELIAILKENNIDLTNEIKARIEKEFPHINMR